MMLCWFDVFLQKSEQFKILLIDGPLIGTATTEVRHCRIELHVFNRITFH